MTGRPVFSQLNIVVRDMDAAIRFYRLLGLDTSSTAGEWAPGRGGRHVADDYLRATGCNGGLRWHFLRGNGGSQHSGTLGRPTPIPRARWRRWVRPSTPSGSKRFVRCCQPRRRGSSTWGLGPASWPGLPRYLVIG